MSKARKSATQSVRKDAALSVCGRFRWWLLREWADGRPETVAFVMLNPSTADATLDDPTIRRCMGFARTWGFARLLVANLFPLRATDPDELLTAEDPTGGPDGVEVLGQVARCERVVAAWGSSSIPTRFAGRREEVLAILAAGPVWCLGRTADGQPRHPLYVAGATLPELFRAGPDGVRNSAPPKR